MFTQTCAGTHTHTHTQVWFLKRNQAVGLRCELHRPLEQKQAGMPPNPHPHNWIICNSASLQKRLLWSWSNTLRHNRSHPRCFQGCCLTGGGGGWEETSHPPCCSALQQDSRLLGVVATAVPMWKRAEMDFVVRETIRFLWLCLESLLRERERLRERRSGRESTSPLSSPVKRVQWIRLIHCHISRVGRVSVTPAVAWATAPRQMVDVTARQMWRGKAAAGLWNTAGVIALISHIF